MYSIAQFWFEQWYWKDVSPNLTTEQKKNLGKKISNLTLQQPIWLDRERNFVDDFPELNPYSHSGNISGLQLVTVMECCLKELQGQKPEIVL